MAMDSSKSDESRDRRGAEASHRRGGEGLDQLAHVYVQECPDAELIAAYHEKSLQQDEITKWEDHFATCTRCRKILLVLAASAGTPLDEKEVAGLGQLVATARPPMEEAHPVRMNWRARLLAPVLGKILPALASEAGKPLSKEEATR